MFCEGLGPGTLACLGKIKELGRSKNHYENLFHTFLKIPGYAMTVPPDRKQGFKLPGAEWPAEGPHRKTLYDLPGIRPGITLVW